MSVNEHARITQLKKRALGAAALGVLVATAGCGGSQNNSAPIQLTGASESIAASSTAHSYVITDNAGNPKTIGVAIQANALSNTPTVVNYPNALPYTLPMPNGVPSSLPFHSITLFTTAGHNPAEFPPGSGIPGPYTVPHLHIAFSLYTTAERGGPPPAGSPAGTPGTGIGGRLWGLTPAIFNNPAQFPTFFDSNFDLPVDPHYVPADNHNPTQHPVSYADFSSIPPGQELPTMGTVYFDPFIPEFNGGPFTTEVDYAFYAGNMSSFNVTSNLNQLVTLNPDLSVATRVPINITKNLDLPPGYSTSGYYPTTYSIRYDASSDSFLFELGGMRFVPATDPNGNPLPQAKKH
jgi:hypothetical protein